jgi:peroxiredoxin
MRTLSQGYDAPALQVSQWFNTDQPITLSALRGRVVVVHAFQMLCPGCVSHGLPQATRVHTMFPASEVVVLGLHTVFEHHTAMQAHALKAFLHEYRIPFPVGVDTPATAGSVPLTMQEYALQGTPSVIVIDRNGLVRLNHFGHLEDLQLGALLGTLLSQPKAIQSPPTTAQQPATPEVPREGCYDSQCAIHT